MCICLDLFYNRCTHFRCKIFIEKVFISLKIPTVLFLLQMINVVSYCLRCARGISSQIFSLIFRSNPVQCFNFLLYENWLAISLKANCYQKVQYIIENLLISASLCNIRSKRMSSFKSYFMDVFIEG